MSVEHHDNQQVSDTELSPKQPGDSRTEDGQKVRQLLVKISKAFQTTQAQFAELLVECHDKGYWATDYSTFADYVDREIGIKLRKAQELMKVWRVCVKFKISPEKIDEIGWSKLAIVGSSINEQNVEDILRNTAAKTYAELQDERRSQRSRTSSKQKTDSKIVVTDVIEKALRLAAAHARDLNTQGCLEQIAKHYLDSVSIRPRLSRRNESN